MLFVVKESDSSDCVEFILKSPDGLDSTTGADMILAAIGAVVAADPVEWNYNQAIQLLTDRGWERIAFITLNV